MASITSYTAQPHMQTNIGNVTQNNYVYCGSCKEVISEHDFKQSITVNIDEKVHYRCPNCNEANIL